jgi:regulator of sirC expression with transglutaminase-like and TPR domain
VLDRRTGIPISLSVLLIEVAGRLGITMEGVGFPGHFLVRVPGAGGPLILDPFFGGRVIRHDEMLSRLRAFYASGGGPAGSNLHRVLPQALQSSAPRAILARMLANLLRIYLEREDHPHALETVELMLVLHPDGVDAIRIRGLLYAQLECVGSAIADFHRFLELAPEDEHAVEVREHLTRLARESRTLH